MSDRYYFNGYPDQLNAAVSIIIALTNKLYDPNDTSKNEAEVKRSAHFIRRLKKEGFIN